MRSEVTLLGGAARRALAPGARWQVLAVFRRSFYLRSAAGSLVCVGAPSIGAGPLSVLCAVPEAVSWEIHGVRPDAPAVVGDGTLQVGGSVVLSLGGAPTWRPVLPPAGWNAAALARGVRAVALESRARAAQDGLAPLIGMLPAAPPAGPGTTVVAAAREAVASLAGWLAAALAGEGVPSLPVPRGVASLLGLGPGLTPSGDDFLGGAMIALHGLGRGDVAARLAAAVLPLAPARTHAISAAHLACAAGGEGMAALHEALALLFSGGSSELGARLDALGAVGHTSGWDALAGAWLAAAAAAGEPSCRSGEPSCR